MFRFKGKNNVGPFSTNSNQATLTWCTLGSSIFSPKVQMTPGASFSKRPSNTAHGSCWIYTTSARPHVPWTSCNEAANLDDRWMPAKEKLIFILSCIEHVAHSGKYYIISNFSSVTFFRVASILSTVFRILECANANGSWAGRVKVKYLLIHLYANFTF